VRTLCNAQRQHIRTQPKLKKQGREIRGCKGAKRQHKRNESKHKATTGNRCIVAHHWEPLHFDLSLIDLPWYPCRRPHLALSSAIATCPCCALTATSPLSQLTAFVSPSRSPSQIVLAEPSRTSKLLRRPHSTTSQRPHQKH
jgi:hypothetical protein